MKRTALALALSLLTLALPAAEPKADVTAAAQKLGAAANYSWHTSVAVPESAQFKPGPTDGAAEKDGFAVIKVTVRDNTMQVVKKGDKVAFTNRDGEWQTPADVEGEQGRGRFIGAMVRNLKLPVAQVSELAEGAKELKQEGDAITGDLKEDLVKNLLSFRVGGGGPNISDPKGSVKFWVKDGTLTKYEFKLAGKMEFNGNEAELDRTTTVEIKDVGTTKIEVPEGAKKKIS